MFAPQIDACALQFLRDAGNKTSITIPGDSCTLKLTQDEIGYVLWALHTIPHDQFPWISAGGGLYHLKPDSRERVYDSGHEDYVTGLGCILYSLSQGWKDRGVAKAPALLYQAYQETLNNLAASLPQGTKQVYTRTTYPGVLRLWLGEQGKSESVVFQTGAKVGHWAAILWSAPPVNGPVVGNRGFIARGKFSAVLRELTVWMQERAQAPLAPPVQTPAERLAAQEVEIYEMLVRYGLIGVPNPPWVWKGDVKRGVEQRFGNLQMSIAPHGIGVEYHHAGAPLFILTVDIDETTKLTQWERVQVTWQKPEPVSAPKTGIGGYFGAPMTFQAGDLTFSRGYGYDVMAKQPVAWISVMKGKQLVYSLVTDGSLVYLYKTPAQEFGRRVDPQQLVIVQRFLEDIDGLKAATHKEAEEASGLALPNPRVWDEIGGTIPGLSDLQYTLTGVGRFYLRAMRRNGKARWAASILPDGTDETVAIPSSDEDELFATPIAGRDAMLQWIEQHQGEKEEDEEKPIVVPPPAPGSEAQTADGFVFITPTPPDEVKRGGSVAVLEFLVIEYAKQLKSYYAAQTPSG